MLSEVFLYRIIRTGLRRGLGGGHWGWLALAGSAIVLRSVNRAEEAPVTRVAATPGERLVITVTDPAPETARRRGRRRHS